VDARLGVTAAERCRHLPGDDIVEDVMTRCTRAMTIDAPPATVWPWNVQIGDRRAGFYSQLHYDAQADLIDTLMRQRRTAKVV
jgi:hypothetical protein